MGINLPEGILTKYKRNANELDVLCQLIPRHKHADCPEIFCFVLRIKKKNAKIVFLTLVIDTQFHIVLSDTITVPGK